MWQNIWRKHNEIQFCNKSTSAWWWPCTYIMKAQTWTKSVFVRAAGNDKRIDKNFCNIANPSHRIIPRLTEKKHIHNIYTIWGIPYYTIWLYEELKFYPSPIYILIHPQKIFLSSSSPSFTVTPSISLLPVQKGEAHLWCLWFPFWYQHWVVRFCHKAYREFHHIHFSVHKYYFGAQKSE